ncbi:hypothetical protein HY734_02525 [Candidatus Uhrbacteria bacterium]|nr:hypothetical protein [Candidatus Uhrbacteria bacterium]
MKKPKNLEARIEEAIVDAYGEDEQRSGFLVMIQENMPVPFVAMLGDIEMQVVDFDETPSRLLARCERGGKKFTVDVLDIEPVKGTTGIEWLEAYRLWRNE